MRVSDHLATIGSRRPRLKRAPSVRSTRKQRERAQTEGAPIGAPFGSFVPRRCYLPFAKKLTQSPWFLNGPGLPPAPVKLR